MSTIRQWWWQNTATCKVNKANNMLSKTNKQKKNPWIHVYEVQRQAKLIHGVGIRYYPWKGSEWMGGRGRLLGFWWCSTSCSDSGYTGEFTLGKFVELYLMIWALFYLNVTLRLWIKVYFKKCLVRWEMLNMLAQLESWERGLKAGKDEAGTRKGLELHTKGFGLCPTDKGVPTTKAFFFFLR